MPVTSVQKEEFKEHIDYLTIVFLENTIFSWFVWVLT